MAAPITEQVMAIVMATCSSFTSFHGLFHCAVAKDLWATTVPSPTGSMLHGLAVGANLFAATRRADAMILFLLWLWGRGAAALRYRAGMNRRPVFGFECRA